MEFKWLDKRAVILILVAGFLIVMTIVSHFRSKSADFDHIQTPSPALSLPISDKPVRPILSLNTESRDEAMQGEMKVQMDKERNQQRQIKMLKMQLEQINLQLDNEKALTEFNKLKKENAGYVKGSNSQAGADFPNVRVMYIGGTEIEKEAILSIDGTSYSVREKDRPVSNIEVLGVTDKGVKVHFSSPRGLTTFINYVQE